jgi:hypothetical protein
MLLFIVIYLSSVVLRRSSSFVVGRRRSSSVVGRMLEDNWKYLIIRNSMENNIMCLSPVIEPCVATTIATTTLSAISRRHLPARSVEGVVVLGVAVAWVRAWAASAT